MAEKTKISWSDATLNWWRGCTKVSPACDFCYAETWENRWGKVKWGVGQPRLKAKNIISKVRRLEKLALAKLARGEGAFFCFSNSLGDIFDNEVPIEWLAEAFAAMRQAPHVTFLLLTKRPQNIAKRSAAAGGLPPNAAIGCTVVNQKEADRDVPHLLIAAAATLAIFTFLSIEPMLGPVDIRWALSSNLLEVGAGLQRRGHFSPGLERLRALGWVITGGESGAYARPAMQSWFMSLRDQCVEAGVAFQHKQNGEWKDIGTAVVERADIERWAKANRPALVDCGRNRKIAIGNETLVGDHSVIYERIGKDAAGRLLGGQEWNQRPDVRMAA